MLKKLVLESPLRSKPEAGPVHVYTDGGVIGNPGPGGYAVAWERANRRPKTITGYSAQTSNNRMELKAVECALRKCPPNWNIIIHSDSQYVVKGMTQWRKGWETGGWVNRQGRPVLNIDLWQAIITLVNSRKGRTQFVWVRGHNGDRMNELVDRLANARARRGVSDG